MNQKKIQFNLSGFGLWGKTERNPSSLILLKIDEKLQQELNISAIKILEVAKDACDEYLNDIQNENSINIHIGLHDELKEFQLEQCAFNKLDYILGDFYGCKTRRIKIDENIQMDEQIKSVIDVQNLVIELTKIGYKVKKSYDPGRFLCNYLYYQSLKKNKNTIFLHVPFFEIVSEEQQFNFLIDLIKILQNMNTQCI